MAAQFSGRAQSYALWLRSVGDGDTAALYRLLQAPHTFPDGASALAFVRGIPATLQESGYLAGSVDSLAYSDDALTATVYTGARYRWAELDLAALPPALRSVIGTSGLRSSEIFRPARLSRATDRALRWADEHGYPFATLRLDSVRITEGKEPGIAAVLRFEPGAQKRVDRIVVEGSAKISPSFLRRYLDLPLGAPYDERKVAAVGMRLRSLPYLTPTRPPRVVFRIDSTTLNLYLDERRSNALDAIIGLLPSTVATGKFLLTVDAQARLQNVLARGESLSFTFQKLQERSSTIRADAAWPFLLGTAFGADARFELYKRDTLFTRTAGQFGATYALAPRDVMRVYYDVRSNRVISADTAYVRTYRQLPPNVSAKASGAGLEFLLDRTDNSLLPRRGTNVRVGGSLLRRRVLPSDAILQLRDGGGFDYAALYDSLRTPSNQYSATATAAGYLPFGRRLVLKVAYHGGFVGAGKPLFRNELFQIGGFRLLRGFDEQSIWASQYHLGTAELRAPLDQSASYLYVFADGGWVESRYFSYRQDGVYAGFGAGATLQTKSGLFTIAYALGTGPDIPFSLKQSKIHFGYLALF